MTFTEKLDYLMAEHQIKNKLQFSKQSGIPYTTIVGFYEKGTENIRRTTLSKLADFFDCSLEYLVNDDVITPRQSVRDDITLSPSELRHIEEYRSLSPDGQQAVDIILKYEVQRASRAVSAVKRQPQLLPLNYYRDSSASAGLGSLDDSTIPDKVMVPDTEVARHADFAMRISGDSMEPRFSSGDIVLVKALPVVEVGDIGIFNYDNCVYIKKYGGSRLISLNKKYDDIVVDESLYFRCAGKVIGKLRESDLVF